MPLRNILYPVTPTLSVDADQAKLIWLEDTTLTARFAGTLGAVVSVEALVFVLTLTDGVELLPAAS
jgi:hypothetical protein